MDLLRQFKRVASGGSVGDKRTVLALDCGTTSSRAILFDKRGGVVGDKKFDLEHEPSRSGACVEYDAQVLLDAAVDCGRRCLEANADSREDVAGVAITNQRETFVLWDKNTGKPYHNAIVWQDYRTAKECEQLRTSAQNVETVKNLAGLFITPYFSASKVKWVQDTSAELRAGIEAGNAMFGTLDTWLIWNLTEGEVYATDTTNASRTGLMDINTLEWSHELKDVFGIDRRLNFPEIRACNAEFGDITTGPLAGKTIVSVIGDQHAALVGNNCLRRGDSKTTYGTGAFLVINTGNSPVQSDKLLTTIGYREEGKPPVYALEGSVASCGTAIEWLAATKRLPARPDNPKKPIISEIEPSALADGGSGGLVAVHALSGLYAPYWCDDATGMTLFQTLNSRNGHYVYATLEGIAFQVGAVLNAAAVDMGAPITEHRVDGGVSNSNLLMQIQADLSREPVYRAKNKETTALGAALLGMLGIGMYSRIEEFESTYKLDKTFHPKEGIEAEVEEKWSRWKIGVKLVIDSADLVRQGAVPDM